MPSKDRLPAPPNTRTRRMPQPEEVSDQRTSPSSLRHGHLSPLGLTPETILQLQRTVGQRAVGRLLQRVRQQPQAAPPQPQASTLIQRSPDPDSIYGAWDEMRWTEEGAAIVGFFTRIIRGSLNGTPMPDGRGGTVTAHDLGTFLGTPEGKKFITNNWRDGSNEQWGNQTLQGQHERIPTNNVSTVLNSLLTANRLQDALQFLAAADMLRDPTRTVYLGVDTKPARIEQMNATPGNFTASQTGAWKHHAQGMFGPRTKPVESPSKVYQQYSKGSTSFHGKLNKQVKARVGGASFQLPELIGDMHQAAADNYWGGDIPGLEPTAAAQIPNDLRESTVGDAELHGRYGMQAQMIDGQSQVTFNRPQNLAQVQQAAKEAKEFNQEVNMRRSNALLTMLPGANPGTAPNPRPAWWGNATPGDPNSVGGSSLWGQLAKDEVYVNDETGMSVAEYDQQYAEAKRKNDHARMADLEMDDDTDQQGTADLKPSMESHGPHLQPGLNPHPPQFDPQEQRIQAFIGTAEQWVVAQRDAERAALEQAVKTAAASNPKLNAKQSYDEGLQQLSAKYGALLAKLNALFQQYQAAKQQFRNWIFANEALQFDRAAFKQQADAKQQEMADQFINACKQLIGV